MQKKRPVTTLFLLTSVDGKISTGETDALDVDKDYQKLPGVKEGLHQYYEIEQTTDMWSMNSGRTMAKVGVNEAAMPDKLDVSFVVIDNSHLNAHGVAYFIALAKTFVLITSNKNHPAFQKQADNLHIIYQEKTALGAALEILYEEYGCERLTIQTGGTLNTLFLWEKLFNYIDLVVAPVLVGGKNTPSILDGVSLKNENELHKLGILKLLKAEVLADSYLRLRYEVVNGS